MAKWSTNQWLMRRDEIGRAMIVVGAIANVAWVGAGLTLGVIAAGHGVGRLADLLG